MSVVAGVDEAGLGPLLGPLVIGFSAFRLPARDDPVHAGSAAARGDLWRALGRAVTRDVARDGERIVVDDSKAVFARNSRGRRRLEATALAFLALLRPGRKPPLDASWMLVEPLCPSSDVLARHPWYELLPARLPLEQEAGTIELAAERLWRTLERAGVELVDAGVRVVPAGELNASFEASGSKIATLWEMTSPVLVHLWRRHAHAGLLIVADQHGGRLDYGPALARDFPDAAVQLVATKKGLREYELVARANATARMRVRVTPRADQGAFATALASCLAKYARETCMGAFNAYFEGLQPGLEPTAGYRTDGWRWMQDARLALARSQLERAVVVRAR